MKPRKIECYKCRDEGWKDQPCPQCGKQKEIVPVAVVPKDELGELKATFESERSINSIPAKYKDVTWVKDNLMKTHESLCAKTLGIGTYDDLNFIEYCNGLERFHRIFKNKGIPDKSCFICAPAGFSKYVLAFDCMKMAADAGYTVAPILDTIELKRYVGLSSERPTIKVYKTMDYEDYITSDVLFITVAKNQHKEWAFEIIQYLLDIRSRKGLSSFILSRYPLGQISERDKTNSFEASLKSVSNDTYKYPSIIQYKELNHGNN